MSAPSARSTLKRAYLRKNGEHFACVKCGGATTVIDSRPTSDNSTIRRRRRCDACGERTSTFEVVAKKVGRRLETRLASIVRHLSALSEARDELDACLSLLKTGEEE